jgi:uncharacterized protein (TIGR00730 family)
MSLVGRVCSADRLNRLHENPSGHGLRKGSVMAANIKRRSPFPPCDQEVNASYLHVDSPQTKSSSYTLAYLDGEFLMRDECRPARLQLELLKPDLVQMDHGILSSVVIFGSARIPDPDTASARLLEVEDEARKNPSDPQIISALQRARRAVANSIYYEQARRLGELISKRPGFGDDGHLVVTTGGGPGIMEAANRGAMDAGAESVGLNIVLPFEQAPNPYITPELNFQFHYFAIRKMHFLMRARALVVFPGGFGTLDELFEVLTLVQTHKVEQIPVLLFGKEFWRRVVNFEALVEEGTIAEKDLNLFRYVETAEQAWEIIKRVDCPDEERKQ